jgi:hypothetical protein
MKVIKVKLRLLWGEFGADQDPLIMLFCLIYKNMLISLTNIENSSPSRLFRSNKHELLISIVKNVPVLFL